MREREREREREEREEREREREKTLILKDSSVRTINQSLLLSTNTNKYDYTQIL